MWYASFFGLYSLTAAVTATALRLKATLATRGNVRDSLCKGRLIDAISVQDSSGSMGHKEWLQILQTTSKLIDAIDVNKNGSHIAPVSFGTFGVLHWGLDDPRARDAKLAKQDVLQLPFRNSTTNTPQALTLAYEALMNVKLTDPARFNNKQLTRLLFVATDGCANEWDKNKYKSVDEHLKVVLPQLNSLENLLILVVGIGSNLCKDEIRRIAGCAPSSTGAPCKNVKYTDFENIFNEIPKYFVEICEAVEEIAEGEGGGGKGGGGNGNENPEDEEGGNNGAAIAGGVLGGLALLGGIAGGAYAYTKPKATQSSAQDTFDAEDEGRDEGLQDREAVVDAGDSMFA